MVISSSTSGGGSRRWRWGYHVDQRNLNLDSNLCGGVNPTTENIAVLFWNALQPRLGALLHELRLFETEMNWVVYRGETVATRDSLEPSWRR